jgi:uncharacterized protein (DUF488 family)
LIRRIAMYQHWRAFVTQCLEIAMQIYTIGFTRKSAERFFSLIEEHQITRLIDVRLNPRGQLAGFTKQADLAYFLRRIVGCDYRHLEKLAPTEEILADYRKDHDWPRYEARFEALMDQRDVPETLARGIFEERVCCLLCSEAMPDQCHRRLVAEHLARHWPGTEIVHLI